MKKYYLGQRWISEAEPELGLGLITDVSDKTLKLDFSASQCERTYGIKTAPLKRVVFTVGDSIKTQEGSSFTITSVEEDSFLFIYKSQDEQIIETELSDSLTFNKPQDRMFNGLIDSNDMFDLRRQTLEFKRKALASPVRGFVGTRLSLIPHQFYVADKVISSACPRVLLADEVGLGKTIEAGLILHKLIITGRAERALVIVPDSLIYQWFIEMFRKFQLSFTTINQETYLEKGSNPFIDNELVIVSLGLLKGAEIARKLMTEASWDMVVVDEAHQLDWKEGKASHDYEIVEEISKTTQGLMLLTATPEQLGLEGHFSRLRLLDPHRFHSFEQYKKEHKNFDVLGPLVNKLHNDIELNSEEENKLKTFVDTNSTDKNVIISELLDRHGTGRIYVRNVRSSMAKEFEFFPKRIVHSYPLVGLVDRMDEEQHMKTNFNHKSLWLKELLENYPDKKILLICRSKNKILALEKFLRENISNVKTGLFHSGLSLMARDRQAAFFAEPKGAQILLCTEIGSEGRNFEFAHHMVLFDLPINPDLLEQRIGRLDRIGQRHDINIHVPLIEKSWDHLLFRWFHEGFNAFELSSKCGSQLFQEFGEQVHNCLNNVGVSEIESLLAETKKRYVDISVDLEKGRDLLVELNSFNHDRAHEILTQVRENAGEDELKYYLEQVFHHLGVDMEDLDGSSYFIKPNSNMFIPHFPGLKNEGMTITFDRFRALQREEFEYVTWDHNMVLSVMDLIQSEGLGNVTVSERKASKNKKSFVECFFVLECISHKKLEAQRFFPPTVIRILVDVSGEDYSEKWSEEFLRDKITSAQKSNIEKAKKVPKDQFNGILKNAEAMANKKANLLIEKYTRGMQEEVGLEVSRLEELAKINPGVRQEEIDLLKVKKALLGEHFSMAQVSLDSYRLIF